MYFLLPQLKHLSVYEAPRFFFLETYYKAPRMRAHRSELAPLQMEMEDYGEMETERRGRWVLESVEIHTTQWSDTSSQVDTATRHHMAEWMIAVMSWD